MIVVIDCTEDNRGRIAQKIDSVFLLHPKVVGLDFWFLKEEDMAISNDLVNVINIHNDSIVFARVDTIGNFLPDTGLYSLLLNSETALSRHSGYVETEKRNKHKRYFKPLKEINSIVDTSFAVKIIKTAFGEHAIKNIIDRANKSEIINYRSAEDIDGLFKIYKEIPIKPEAIKNKIVLFGSVNDLNDQHFTPLNKFSGISHADMPGVVYNAQVISMVANNEYINQLNWCLKYFFVFLGCGLFNFVFYLQTKISKSKMKHLWLHGFILLYSIFLIVIMYLGFENSNRIKIEPVEFILPAYFCLLFKDSIDLTWQKTSHLITKILTKK
ncbi:MAG: CHASE2 domain-containing protein [Bacteroidetes bacterium]|nr:CHASE2 domain-containing protein [Bacteroidota bacterium]